LQRAIAHRLRRVYLPLLLGLLFVWIVRLTGADEPLVQAAAVSGTPGWVVLVVVGLAYAVLVLVAVVTDAGATSEMVDGADRGDLRRSE
jgi:uncharacterized membrane protein